MKNILSFILVAFFFQSCFAVDTPESNAAPVSHEIFDKLLKKYVSSTGFVNYGGFKAEQKEFKKYQDLLSSNAPASSWSKNDKLAYWINAYNAFTIQLILDNADQNLTSIKDIGSKIKIPFVNTPWDVKFIQIGGKKYDLNNIEHGIIRKQFNDPRIHFALVCAAKSCPPLRNEAYTGANLNSQLDDQGRDFINDANKNEVSKNSMELSKLFDWYGGDFKGMSKIDWVNKYAKVKADKNASISYKTYDWALNGKL
ncbi:DUF547 domain-containing protein [Lacihabitans lacunae]|jgi:hypothetical protein|uniref:DUF547 domain-containing protein n=1 Tax=Lacihabitans lacunae TaxID=1028214 RepID=A0ABV7YVW5_9BACT